MRTHTQTQTHQQTKDEPPSPPQEVTSHHKASTPSQIVHALSSHMLASGVRTSVQAALKEPERGEISPGKGKPNHQCYPSLSRNEDKILKVGGAISVRKATPSVLKKQEHSWKCQSQMGGACFAMNSISFLASPVSGCDLP